MITANSYLDRIVPVIELATHVDLSTMRLAHGYSFRVLQDGNGDSLFELVDKNGNAYMAFLYRACLPEDLDRLRDAISTCWYPINRFPLSRAEAVNSVPLIAVDQLPRREMWEAHSSWQEDLFWALPDLIMEIQDQGNNSVIEIMRRGEGGFVYLRMPHRSPTDEPVIRQALDIRAAIRSRNQIKIQTKIGDMTASWYFPARRVTN